MWQENLTKNQAKQAKDALLMNRLTNVVCCFS